MSGNLYPLCAITSSNTYAPYYFPNTKVMFEFTTDIGYNNHNLQIKYSLDGGSYTTRNYTTGRTITLNNKSFTFYGGLLKFTNSLSLGKHQISYSVAGLTRNQTHSSYTTRTFTTNSRI